MNLNQSKLAYMYGIGTLILNIIFLGFFVLTATIANRASKEVFGYFALALSTMFVIDVSVLVLGVFVMAYTILCMILDIYEGKGDEKNIARTIIGVVLFAISGSWWFYWWLSPG
ncbi:MAG: hypothetical protein ACYTHM_04060 [Planctomycetota bacterium]|jgi:hypothetical protein